MKPIFWKRFYLILLFLVGFFSFLLWSIQTVQLQAAEIFPKAPLLFQQAQSYYSLGKYQAAIALLEKILASEDSSVVKAQLHCWLAAAYRQVGQLGKATQHWEQALKVYRQNEDSQSRFQLAGVLVDQAQVYNELGQFRRAIPVLEEALELGRQIKEIQIEKVAQGVLGDSHLMAGDYHQAIEAYQISLSLVKDPDSLITALNNLSHAYDKRSQQSLRLAEAAREERDQTEETRLQGLALSDREAALVTATRAVEESHHLKSLSAVRARLHLMSLSSQDYRQSVKAILEQLPDSSRKAYELINFADFLVGKAAIQILEEARATARHLEDFRAESLALGALGRHYEEAKDYDQALRLTQQAQIAAGQVSAQDSLYRWFWQAGRIYQARGKVEQAKGAYRQAIATLQTIRGDIAIASKKLQFDVRDEVEPVYREFLELLLESSSSKEIKEALEVAELLQLSQLQNFFGDDCVEILAATSKPSEILLPPNIALIRTIILKEKTYLILQLPNGFLKRYAVALSAQQLQEDIQRWRRQLENFRLHEYLGLSQDFYNLLIRPLEADLAQTHPRTLLFINDGILRNVPLAALSDGKQFLIEKYALAAALGFNFISQAHSSWENLNSLSFGLTVAIPPFNALPNVGRETEAVQKLLGGRRFLDEDFTLKNLQSQILTNHYPVVHLATHGRFAGDADSAFLQAFEQRISLAQLEDLLKSSQKPIELLTLSACQTAAGNDRSVLGLAGVAVRSGVRSTLGSLWYVNDAAMVELVTDFYQNLKQGMTKAEALQKAQVKQIANPQSHPSSWAMLVLIGN